MTTEIEIAEKPKSQLRYLHDTQVSLEKLRISLGNRIAAMERGDDEQAVPVPKVYTRIFGLAEEMEVEIDRALQAEVSQWPVYRTWLRHVRGIGPNLASQLLALLLPPRADMGVSTWYKAAGLAPELRPDGQHRLPRARKGEGKIRHHPRLRRDLHNVATSFVRGGGYYRMVYDAEKARLVQIHAGDESWPAYRVDSAARWATVRLFLSHLWSAWCEAEGIHDRGPYGLVTLTDGTKVIRVTLRDGATMDHAYIERPLPDGSGRL